MPTRIISPLLKTGILTALATALLTAAPHTWAIFDFDGDGVADIDDNCPEIANPDQTNSDFDFDYEFLGDACDDDDDDDGVSDVLEDLFGSDTTNPDVLSDDFDGDGYNNLIEILLGSAADDINSIPESVTFFEKDFTDISQIHFAPYYAWNYQDWAIELGRGDTENIIATLDIPLNPAIDGIVKISFYSSDGVVLPDVYINGVKQGNEIYGETQADYTADLTMKITAGPTLITIAHEIPTSSDQVLQFKDIIFAADTDNDGIIETEDNCTLISNTDQLNSDNDSFGDVCDDDDDDDGISDDLEATLNTDPKTPTDATEDFDGDGYNNLIEVLLGSSPTDSESIPATTDDLVIDFSSGRSDRVLATPSQLWALDDTGDVGTKSYRTLMIPSVIYDEPYLGDIDETITSQFTVALNNASAGLLNIVFLENNDSNPYAAAAITVSVIIDGSENVNRLGYRSLTSGPHLVTIVFTAEFSWYSDTYASLNVDAIAFGQDADNDGIVNQLDNCPYQYEEDQTDSDGDGLGDLCDYGDADTDSDGVADIDDNCPLVYNPYQENYEDSSLLFIDSWGDACDTDDDQDGLSDALEATIESRDPRYRENFYGDSDSDGAVDVYEWNIGTDPFVYNEFETIDITLYFPLGNIEYTYEAFSDHSGTPSLHDIFTGNIEALENNQFHDDAVGLIGLYERVYEIREDGIYITQRGYDGEITYPDGLKYLPFEMREGESFYSETTAQYHFSRSESPRDYTEHNLIIMLDKGVMEFNGQQVNYITLFDGERNSRFLEGIGRYGMESLHIISANTDDRVDIKQIAADIAESSQTPEIPEPVTEQTVEPKSSSGGGGSLSPFWLLIACISVVFRQRYFYARRFQPI